MEKTPAILQKVKVRSVKINRLEKSLVVDVVSETYVPLEEEKELLEHFKGHFGTENLAVVCCVQGAELGEREKQDIIGRMVDHCPTLLPYRERITFEKRENSVVISYPDVCERLLAAAGSIRHISSFLSKGLQMECDIICAPQKADNGREEFDKIRQELKSRNSEENKRIINDFSKVVKKPEKVNKYGRNRSYTEVRLREISNEFKLVAFECEIIDVESNVTKRGKTMFKFDVTDYTSSITCKMFCEGSEAREHAKLLQAGASIRVEGSYGYDNYDSQNIVMAKNVTECEPLHMERVDTADSKRVELHLHTKMSSKDGFIEPSQLFRTLKDWGHTAVAITDHGVVQAFPEAFEKAEIYGIKPIFGVEGYLVDDGPAFMTNPDDHEIKTEMFVFNKGEDCEIILPDGSTVRTRMGDTDAIQPPDKGCTVICSGWPDERFMGYPVINFNILFDRLGATGVDMKGVMPPGEINGAGDLREAWNRFMGCSFMEGIRSTNDLCILVSGKTMNVKLRQYHVIILAKNNAGLKSLYELISYSHINFFYKKPRIPKSILEAKRTNLVIGSACEAGELYSAAVEGRDDDTLKSIARFYDYLEIQPVDNNSFMVRDGILGKEDDIRNLNMKIDGIGLELGIPVAATCDAHFFSEEDAIYRKIIMHGMKYKDVESQAPLFMRTTDEMLGEFSYLGEDRAYKAVVEVPSAISDSIESLRPIPKGTFAPSIEGADEDLREICRKRVFELYGENLPELIEKRMNKELDSIINNGYAVMYIIAQKLSLKSQENGYLVGSRGSVGSSFAAFLSGITEVNPLQAHYICRNCYNIEFADPSQYDCGLDMPDKECPVCKNQYAKDGFDIPFETFLGFEGNKMPDIDQNFSGEYQARAHKHVEELFGSSNVFKAGTISTIADKTAFGFVKGYLEENNIPHNKAEIKRLVKGCAGVKRTTGQHPGGMVVLPEGYSINDFTPVQRPANDTESDTVTTHFDFNSMHDTLLKLDILGHDDPTIIRMLEDLTGTKAKEINIRDPKIMSLFSSAEVLGFVKDIDCSIGVLGIPEFGTKFVRGMLKTAVPSTISELIKISGLSHGENVWSNNAEDLIKNGTATLQEVISIRDNIMLYLIHHGMDSHTAFEITEKVRKKSSNITPEHEKVMLEHGVPKWYVESCKKIEYMFPKAHAAAYVIMALRIAWYKIYYPKEYYAAYFSIRADEFEVSMMTGTMDEIRARMTELRSGEERMNAREQNIFTILEIVEEMMARGIDFLPVDLRLSGADRFLCEEDGIRLPLSAVGGIGTKAARTVVRARNKKEFMSVSDLSERGKITKTAIEKLRELGALGDLPESSQRSFF